MKKISLKGKEKPVYISKSGVQKLTLVDINLKPNKNNEINGLLILKLENEKKEKISKTFSTTDEGLGYLHAFFVDNGFVTEDFFDDVDDISQIIGKTGMVEIFSKDNNDKTIFYI